MSCGSEVRDTLRRLIHSCYAGKMDAGECLQSLYKEIDDDENWGGTESDEIEEYEDDDTELDGEEEPEEQSGGFLDMFLGMLIDYDDE